MPPKRTREQPGRQVQESIIRGLAPEVVAKRTKRHLEELERTNYTEPTLLAFGDDEDDGSGSKYAKGRARQLISDKRNVNAGPNGINRKKKQTMNIRTALLYRKNLATLIEESNISQLPSHIPTYLTAIVPPPQTPPRLLCSVCGYWGRYKCRRCGMPYCDRNCESVHAETRCERRVV